MRKAHVVLQSMLVCVAAIAGPAVASDPDPDHDPQLVKLLDEVPDLLKEMQPAAGIEKCDAIIRRFEAHYAGGKQTVYCSRSSAETLAYLLKGATAADKGSTPKKEGTTAISSTWADAYFIKGYALQELGKVADAKTMIERAVELSPLNAQYLCELGTLYQREKDWPKAAEIFRSAEDNAGIAPENAKAIELARARRGLAYVLVEQGKLDEAEKKYQQCLADDPNDERASRELEYVRGLKAKNQQK